MKTGKKSIVIFLIILVVLGTLFGVYVSDYYKADDTALDILSYSTTREEGNYTVLTPDTSNGRGIVFYPGGKVEDIAYLPLLEKLRERGYTCILVKMPFNLAFFGKNRADDAYELVSEVESWYLVGHSLGGAMGSDYAGKNTDKIQGVVLLGAFNYGEFPSENALMIYGSNDSSYDAENFKLEENVIIIDGGNHAYFGNYGEQEGDGAATITREEQQETTVLEICRMIESR